MRDAQRCLDTDIMLWRPRFQRWAKARKTVVGYGAAAKATVWLNAIGVGPQWMDYVVDETPEKNGLYIPGTGIRILRPEVLGVFPPDVIIILAHNYADEIRAKLEPHPPGTELWSSMHHSRLS